MKLLALSAIAFYQRRLSPYKGFCCAYSAYTGHSSCSALGYRAVRQYGLFTGIGVLRQRFERCGAAYRRGGPRVGARHGQRGFCDLSCDLPCDLPSSDCLTGACDAVSCCDAPGDCGSSRKKGQEEKYVYIPPARRG